MPPSFSTPRRAVLWFAVLCCAVLSLLAHLLICCGFRRQRSRRPQIAITYKNSRRISESPGFFFRPLSNQRNDSTRFDCSMITEA